MARLCLNMIVRNESHIILECLESMAKHICYWIISDTGSTDGTQEIIKKFFEEKGIPGELHEDKWVDFATNRNIALDYGYKREEFDYLWVMDADDYLEGTPDFPEVMDADVYAMKIRSTGKNVGFRGQIFSNKNKNLKYECIVHETIRWGEKDVVDVLDGKYYINIRTIGSRNKDPLKFLKDAELCLKGMEFKDEFYERYCFYAANMYYNLECFRLAAIYYQKNIDEAPNKHVYDSLIHLAFCFWDESEKKEKIISALNRAIDLYPERRDAYFHLARYYNQLQNFEEAYKLITKCITLDVPEDANYYFKESLYTTLPIELLAEILANINAFDESIGLLKFIDDKTEATEYVRENIKKVEAEKLIYFSNRTLQQEQKQIQKLEQ